MYSPDGEWYCPTGSDIRLAAGDIAYGQFNGRIQVHESRKAFLSLSEGKYHSGQSPEYHFYRYSKHRILSLKPLMDLFRIAQKEGSAKFALPSFLESPSRRGGFFFQTGAGDAQTVPVTVRVVTPGVVVQTPVV